MSGIFVALLTVLAGIDIDPYAFACDGEWLGIPHFLNVVTNVPFFFVGLWGLAFLLRTGRLHERRFFNWVGLWLSVAVLMFGSGAYHWYLTPGTLAFDRFCITGIIAFMGSEIAAVALGWGPRRRTSLLIFAICAATVVVWMLGATSWYYGVLQGAGGLGAVAVAIWAYRRGKIGRDVLQPILLFAAFYALAKVAEVLDEPVCALTGVVGGHPIKHLLSAAGLLCLGGWMKAAARSQEADRTAA